MLCPIVISLGPPPHTPAPLAPNLHHAKQPTTSYMQFNNANRARIKTDNPDASFAEIAKMVSEEWKGLTLEDKKKYEDMAAKDKVRYTEAMKNYTPPAGFDKDGKGKVEKGRSHS